MKMVARILSLLLIIFLLCGCGASLPTADVEREINYYMNLAPTNLDPQMAFSLNNYTYLGMFTEGLFTRDENGNLINGLAEDYDVSGDGLSYTFQLREDAMWSNGTPITAQDFVFAWQRVVDPKNASDAVFLFLNCVDMAGTEDVFYNGAPLDELGVKALSAHTLQVSLDSPCPYFPELLTSPSLAPCNEEFYFSHAKDYGKRSSAILSSGPYMVDYYEPLALQIHLSKNPYYYDAEKVAVPGISLQVITDVQQMIMCFGKGEADAIPISGEQQEVSEGDPRLKEISGSMIYYLLTNGDNKALSNRNIRRALSLSINRELLQKNLLRAGHTVLTRLIPKDFFMEPDGTDFGGQEDRYADYCGYDTDRAREYWDKGLKELGITELSVEYLDVETSVIMDMLKEEWENTLPGFTMNYRTVPQKVLFQEMKDGNFDIVLTGWGADYADPSAFLNVFRTDSAYNYGHYSNADFDMAMKACENTPLALDPGLRVKKLHEAEEMMEADPCIIK